MVINYLKGIHMFKPSSYFYVKFHNVNGLTKSSPVFADGFRVGIVRDLYYDYTQPGKVVAEIDVNTDLRIPKGSTAELATEMLGGVKMNLLLANNPREKYQGSILDMIKEYQRSTGSTVIIVSHSMEDVARLCTKVYVMNGGKVAMSGSVAEVYSRGNELKNMGLNVPQVTDIFIKLKERGVDCKTDIYTLEQAQAELRK